MTPAETSLNATQQQWLNAALRENESLLLAAACCAYQGSLPLPTKPKSSFWSRILGKKNEVPQVTACPHFFAITSKRLLLFTDSAAPREWFLMLGMIQGLKLQADGTGDITIDYDLSPAGDRILVGMFGIANAQQVHDLLASAIDTAYNASPWSV